MEKSYISEPRLTTAEEVTKSNAELRRLASISLAKDRIAKAPQRVEDRIMEKIVKGNAAFTSGPLSGPLHADTELNNHKPRRKRRIKTGVRKIKSFLVDKNGVLTDSEDEPDSYDNQSHRKTTHVKKVRQTQGISIQTSYRLLVCALSAPFIPAGFAVNYARTNPITVFVVNFCGTFASASIITMMMECLLPLFGMAMSTLIYECLNNLPQIVTSALLLRSGQITILQSSMLGGMLSNLLLMIGLGMFMGGVTRIEQYFSTNAVGTHTSCLFLATGALIAPLFMKSNKLVPEGQINTASRVISILLITAYIAFLFFRHITHTSFFERVSERNSSRMFTMNHRKHRKRRIRKVLPKMGAMAASIASSGSGNDSCTSGDDYSLSDHWSRGQSQEFASPADEAMSPPPSSEASKSTRWKWVQKLNQNPDSLVRFSYYRESRRRHHLYFEQRRLVLLPIWMLVIGLILAPVLLTFNTSFAVDSLDGLLARTSMSPTFLSFVLLPLFNNDPDTIGSAIGDKMDICLQRNIGKQMQTIMLVIPFIVLVAWMIGVDEMTLAFDGFQVIVVCLAVLLVTSIVGMMRSNWLEGVILLAVFFNVAVACWYIR